MSDIVASNETIVVVGGGISGMTSALEAAECGKQVILIEKNASLGGRVAQLHKYFPKMCHPTCGMEINLQRAKKNRNLRILTMAEVTEVTGESGDYSLKVSLKPRYINENCTACGECEKAVEAEFDDEFNYGMSKRKGAYLPHNMAYPQRFVLDANIIGTDDASKAKEACKYDAIDLDMQDEVIDLKAGAIIWATGWQPYDANKIQPYGYDRYENVITNVEFERLMDPQGPTGGKLVRPSDGKEAKNVAFIQCAGSRDRNHLRHCSRICCMASLKQTKYVRGAFPEDGKVSIYYIDIRAIDRFEVLKGVDTEGYNRYETPYDLVVLATGMQPSVDQNAFPIDIVINQDGFIEPDENNGAIFAAGSTADALDVNRSVQHATAAALRAIQVVNKAAGTGA
jgi:quinone-modifying oxidoreductase subunit QmoA